MKKMKRLDLSRQLDLVSSNNLTDGVTIIGAGSVGSFTALTISKMGVEKIEIFDEDGVDTHNIPNQFYKLQDIGEFKVDALESVLKEFCGVSAKVHNTFYDRQKLNPIVIVATDSMESRWAVWLEFLKQPQTKVLIEARMGGELGIVYCVSKKEKKFYEKTLYSDSEAEQLPCSARTIIYNVLMIASIIARTLKGVVKNESIPNEFVFNMANMDSINYPYMTRRANEKSSKKAKKK